MDDNLYQMARELCELYKTAYAIMQPRVTRIIKNNITDNNEIERCLDDLLNYPTDDCYDLFLQLCNYYKKINSKTAIEYLEIYKEMYLNESLPEELLEEPKAKKKS